MQTVIRLTAAAAALACALAALPASAAEEKPFSFEDFLSEPRDFAMDEIAADLAYGYCPLFLAGAFQLDAPELKERGFDPKIETAPDERFGEISMVSAKRTDGRIAFGGAPGKACLIVIDGPQRDKALAALRERMGWTGLEFKPTEAPVPARPGMTVETYKAPADGQFLYVQLVQTDTINPLLSAVIYGQAD